MEVPFAGSRLGTLGVEWEIALVDREGRDLASESDAVLALLDERAPGHRVHRELLKNTVELVTDVAGSVAEAMAETEYARQRRIVTEAGGDLAAVVIDSAQRLQAGASAHG